MSYGKLGSELYLWTDFDLLLRFESLEELGEFMTFFNATCLNRCVFLLTILSVISLYPGYFTNMRPGVYNEMVFNLLVKLVDLTFIRSGIVFLLTMPPMPLYGSKTGTLVVDPSSFMLETLVVASIV